MVMPDLTFQYGWDCVRDLQTRVLNASLLTNLAITSAVSRVIFSPAPPSQLKAHWAEPALDIDDNRVTLSAAISGGVRHVFKGFNLSLRGTVSAPCRPIVTMAADGLPVAALTAPSPHELSMTDVKLTYGGGDDLVTWLDIAAERTLLRPVLAAQLIAPLAGLPLNYVPSSMGHLLAGDRGASSGWAASVESDHDALTLARVHPGSATQDVPALLSTKGGANVAVGISESGLNAVLRRLCLPGPAADNHEAGGLHQWRWTDATATLTGPAIRITGHLRQTGTTALIDTALRCSITDRGRLHIGLTDQGLPSESARAVVQLWTTVIRCLFSTDRATDESPVLQEFHVPGTRVCATAPLVAITVLNGCLVARYALPRSNQPLALTIDDAEPKPVIRQPVVPKQTAPGTPVTATLVSVLPHAPEPPYDYVWRVGDRPQPEALHAANMTITRTPAAPTAMQGQQTATLASVDLKVIDMLGRVGEARYTASYQPAQQHRSDNKRERHPRRTRRRVLRASLVAAAAAAALVVGLLTAARGAAPTPAPSLSPSRSAAVEPAPTTSNAPPTIAPASTSPPPPATTKPTTRKPTSPPTTSRTTPTPGATPDSPTTNPAPPPPPPLTISLLTSAGACAPSTTCDPAPTCPGCSATFVGDCSQGVTLQFTTDISVNRGPTSIGFRWIINGSPFSADNVDFSGPGSQHQTVGQVTVLYVSSGPWTAQLEILSPNPMKSNIVTATTTCAPV